MDPGRFAVESQRLLATGAALTLATNASEESASDSGALGSSEPVRYRLPAASVWSAAILALGGSVVKTLGRAAAGDAARKSTAASADNGREQEFTTTGPFYLSKVNVSEEKGIENRSQLRHGSTIASTNSRRVSTAPSSAESARINPPATIFGFRDETEPYRNRAAVFDLFQRNRERQHQCAGAARRIDLRRRPGFVPGPAGPRFSREVRPLALPCSNRGGRQRPDRNRTLTAFVDPVPELASVVKFRRRRSRPQARATSRAAPTGPSP